MSLLVYNEIVKTQKSLTVLSTKKAAKFIAVNLIIMIFKNAISWFEIPSTDIDRAQKFYETIFDIQMIPLDMPQLKMRIFPIEDPMNIGGAITVMRPIFTNQSADSGPVGFI